MKKGLAILLVLVFLWGMIAIPARAEEEAAPVDELELLNFPSDFVLGNSAYAILTGGATVYSVDESTGFYATVGGIYRDLYSTDRELLVLRGAKSLNLIENTLYYSALNKHNQFKDVYAYDLEAENESYLFSSEEEIRQLYIVADCCALWSTASGIYLYSFEAGDIVTIYEEEGLSFFPTPWGLVYISAEEDGLTLFTQHRVIATGADSYTVYEERWQLLVWSGGSATQFDLEAACGSFFLFIFRL